ncbi:MAG: hypothetical protein JSU91_00805 [Thermoplasmatales archaeon]|nr:MAG: hypothetical protein JSU91_00805 [Thermoplasmatales archaeon]
MYYNLLKKMLVFGIIVLFFGTVVASGVNNTKNVSSDEFGDISFFNHQLNIRNEFDIAKGEYIDQQQTTHGVSGYNINYGQFVAQSFKPSVERLSKVDLKIFRYNGVPDYDLEFCLRDNLNGVDLLKVTKSGNQVIDGWNEFDFTDIEVQVDKTYYLVCEGDGGHGDEPIYCWYTNPSNPYDRGMVHIFNYGSWHNVYSSDCCFITYYNNLAPYSPTISGPKNGKTGIYYDFKFISNDPDDDDLYYYIDWGDDYIDEWIGPFGSSHEITRSHRWEEEGTYIIKAKVKDTCNMESNWASFEVNIPRNRETSISLLYWFLERFSLLEIRLSLFL